MRKIAIVMMAAFMMSTALPVLAAEQTKAEKDQCLLYSKSCVTEVDTLQKRIKKLNMEIKKGKKVYTPDELKRLNDKLKETEEVLKELEEKP